MKKKYYNNNDIIIHKLSMHGYSFFPANYHMKYCHAMIRNCTTITLMSSLKRSCAVIPQGINSHRESRSSPHQRHPHMHLPSYLTPSPHPLKSLKLSTQTFPMRQRPQRHMEAKSGQNVFWNAKMLPVLIVGDDKNQTWCRSSPVFITFS